MLLKAKNVAFKIVAGSYAENVLGKSFLSFSLDIISTVELLVAVSLADGTPE